MWAFLLTAIQVQGILIGVVTAFVFIVVSIGPEYDFLPFHRELY